MTDLTEGQRLYAIGDIHGLRDRLAGTLERIRADLAARPHPHPKVITVGDYVDRGPDSRGVIDLLIELRDSDLPSEHLLGNHDSYVLAYLEDPDWFDRPFHWLEPNMGGVATLASYGVEGASARRPGATRDAFAAALPAAHREFLEGCALWRRAGGYVFAHAGIRPGVPMEAQERDDLIWIREPFLSSTEDFGFIVVHGHTITSEVDRRANRIGIDTGAFRGGPLTCLVLEGAEAQLLEPGGLRPLPPPERGPLGALRRGLAALRGG